MSSETAPEILSAILGKKIILTKKRGRKKIRNLFERNRPKEKIEAAQAR